MKIKETNILEFMNKQSIISKVSLLLGIIFLTYFYMSGTLKIGAYGGIESYKISGILAIFFIEISIMMALFSKSSVKLSYVGVFYLVLLLRFSIFLFEKVPMFPFVYTVYGHTKYIVLTGHSNPDILKYQTWPGIMYLGAILWKISGLGIYIMTIVRIVILTTIITSFYLLLSIFSKKDMIIPGILFGITSLYGLYYYVPMSLAIALETLGIYLLFAYLHRPNKKIVYILFIMTLSLTITHLLTSIVFSLTVFVLLILNTFFVNIRSDIKKMYFVIVILSFVSISFWIASHQYTTNLLRLAYSPNILNDIITKFMQAIHLTTKTAKTAVVGVSSHSKILKIKMYYVYSVLGLSGFSLLLLFFNSKGMTKRLYLPVMSLFLLGTYMVGIPALVGPYSGEIYSRVLEYSVWVLVLVISSSLNNRKFKAIISIFLLISPYLYVLCTYGNMEYDYVSPNEIIGISYVSVNIPSSFYAFSNPLWNIEIKYLEKRWKYILPVTTLINKPGDYNNCYVVFSSRMEDGYFFFTGNKLNLKSIQLKCSKIYSSTNHYPSALSLFEIYYR